MVLDNEVKKFYFRKNLDYKNQLCRVGEFVTGDCFSVIKDNIRVCSDYVARCLQLGDKSQDVVDYLGVDVGHLLVSRYQSKVVDEVKKCGLAKMEMNIDGRLEDFYFLFLEKNDKGIVLLESFSFPEVKQDFCQEVYNSYFRGWSPMRGK